MNINIIIFIIVIVNQECCHQYKENTGALFGYQQLPNHALYHGHPVATGHEKMMKPALIVRPCFWHTSMDQYDDAYNSGVDCNYHYNNDNDVCCTPYTVKTTSHLNVYCIRNAAQ